VLESAFAASPDLDPAKQQKRFPALEKLDKMKQSFDTNV
jgi:hypothetical protein